MNLTIQARFSTSQTGVGYQFYDGTGALLGSRVTSGISALPELGGYVATATLPPEAVGVFWNTDTSEASEDLREANTAEILSRIGTPAVTLADDIAGISGGGGGGGLTADAIAALEAADQILLAESYVPSVAPSVVIPAPSEDATLSLVYLYTENILAEKRKGIQLTIRLLDPPAKGARAVEKAEETFFTDAEGLAQITVLRGFIYRVSCEAVGLQVNFTPTSATYDLSSLIT